MSSIFHLVRLKRCCIPKISFLGCLEQNWCHLWLQNNWVCLPYKKNIEFVFHISSSWVKIRLPTENQLLWLPRTKLRLYSIWNKLRLTLSLCRVMEFKFQFYWLLTDWEHEMDQGAKNMVQIVLVSTHITVEIRENHDF